MTKRTKITLGSLAIAGVIFGILVIVSTVQTIKGIDASKEDPQKLFMFYVQRVMPPDISVQSAVGHANFGGTDITFRLKITDKGLDGLIASKGLRKEDSLQEHLFPDKDLAAMRQPEFYATDNDMTWSKLGTTVRMVADRDTGIAFYMVFCP
ncbi:MAG TPA: hypothetical protein VNN22_00435 [Verrucomicrobiae bacterium]|nr:hypothetical protein [Verrucomicrobiae bacterium]